MLVVFTFTCNLMISVYEYCSYYGNYQMAHCYKLLNLVVTLYRINLAAHLT